MCRVTGLVRRRILPLPRGRLSSASTAKEELQGVSSKWSWPTNSLSMKFPAAPESSSAVVWIVWLWAVILTGRVMLETELNARVLSLTGRWSDDGRTGQVFLIWPAWPQYRQSWFCMRRSLSWGVRGVNPSCIGSVAYWDLGGERGCGRGLDRAVRRERIRLSRWIVSSMNWQILNWQILNWLSHRSPRSWWPSPKLCRWVVSTRRQCGQIRRGKVLVAGWRRASTVKGSPCILWDHRQTSQGRRVVGWSGELAWLEQAAN